METIPSPVGYHRMHVSFRAVVALSVFVVLSVGARAVETKATLDGISINAGAAGAYVMSYPKLCNPMDANLKPENITVKPDGSGATMSYTPSGKLTLDKQLDGSWLYHITEIPPDRVKFSFGIPIPLDVAGQGATWAFNGLPPVLFPKDKGKVQLYVANIGTFAFAKGGSGFVCNYPQKTFVTLADQRGWGKQTFVCGQILYFPNHKTLPEISYSFKIEDLPSTSAPQPVAK